MYQARIRGVLMRVCVENDGIERDPAIVEAWMRVAHPTLDSLSAAEFDRQVIMSAVIAGTSQHSANVALAASFGLKTWDEAEREDAKVTRP